MIEMFSTKKLEILTQDNQVMKKALSHIIENMQIQRDDIQKLMNITDVLTNILSELSPIVEENAKILWKHLEGDKS